MTPEVKIQIVRSYNGDQYTRVSRPGNRVEWYRGIFIYYNRHNDLVCDKEDIDKLNQEYKYIRQTKAW